MTGLVYDSGALIAADRDDRRMWALHSRALTRGVRPIVPAACVAEAWRGKQRSLAKLLAGCAVDSPTLDAAQRAGALLRNNAAGAVDALVVEAALRHRSAVVSSDRDDLAALAAAGRRRRLNIIDV